VKDRLIAWFKRLFALPAIEEREEPVLDEEPEPLALDPDVADVDDAALAPFAEAWKAGYAAGAEAAFSHVAAEREAGLTMLREITEAATRRQTAVQPSRNGHVAARYGRESLERALGVTPLEDHLG
jgi:hypothetical protein